MRLAACAVWRRRLVAPSIRFKRFPTFMILDGLMSTVRERATQFMVGGVAGACFAATGGWRALRQSLREQA